MTLARHSGTTKLNVAARLSLCLMVVAASLFGRCELAFAHNDVEPQTQNGIWAPTHSYLVKYIWVKYFDNNSILRMGDCFYVDSLRGLSDLASYATDRPKDYKHLEDYVFNKPIVLSGDLRVASNDKDSNPRSASELLNIFVKAYCEYHMQKSKAVESVSFIVYNELILDSLSLDDQGYDIEWNFYGDVHSDHPAPTLTIETNSQASAGIDLPKSEGDESRSGGIAFYACKVCIGTSPSSRPPVGIRAETVKVGGRHNSKASENQTAEIEICAGTGTDANQVEVGEMAVMEVSATSGAGISAKDITIHKGTVKARGVSGAGIGGSSILIEGGTIEATSRNGAGIGSDYQGAPVTVQIDDGEVSASSCNGAAIGMGMDAQAGKVIINGGVIYAAGADNGLHTLSSGAGIGGGNSGRELAAGYEVLIHGGEVHAGHVESGASIAGVKTVGVNGAGIGAGAFGGEGTVTIDGGTIWASSTEGAGIGGGPNSGSCAVSIGSPDETTISISASSEDGAGIGGGSDGNRGTVTIQGGTIHATSVFGAGIGGGYCGIIGSEKDGIVSIEDGVSVEATSISGAGIGGGYRTRGGIIAINGAKVSAQTSSATAQGIGHGEKVSDDMSGSLTLAEGLSVQVNDALFVIAHDASELIGACREKNVLIDTCMHQAEYALPKNAEEHDVCCAHCGAYFRTEPHVFHATSDGGIFYRKCSICGYEDLPKTTYTVSIPASLAVGGEGQCVQVSNVSMGYHEVKQGKTRVSVSADERVALTNTEDRRYSCTANVDFPEYTLQSGSGAQPISVSVPFPPQAAGHYEGTLSFHVALK